MEVLLAQLLQNRGNVHSQKPPELMWWTVHPTMMIKSLEPWWNPLDSSFPQKHGGTLPKELYVSYATAAAMYIKEGQWLSHNSLPNVPMPYPMMHKDASLLAHSSNTNNRKELGCWAKYELPTPAPRM